MRMSSKIFTRIIILKLASYFKPPSLFAVQRPWHRQCTAPYSPHPCDGPLLVKENPAYLTRHRASFIYLDYYNLPLSQPGPQPPTSSSFCSTQHRSRCAMFISVLLTLLCDSHCSRSRQRSTFHRYRVRTGYLNTGLAVNNNLSNVMDEINAYSGWNEDYRPEGILFDQVEGTSVKRADCPGCPGLSWDASY